ncbi:hypothetical protein ACFLS1_06055, partial [Verrucomicrobiota bacterium]
MISKRFLVIFVVFAQSAFAICASGANPEANATDLIEQIKEHYQTATKRLTELSNELETKRAELQKIKNQKALKESLRT